MEINDEEFMNAKLIHDVASEKFEIAFNKAQALGVQLPDSALV